MEAGVGGGNCAGLVAVAAVSAAVTLATVRIYRGLESDFRKKIQLQQHGGETAAGVRPATGKKKVRFADDVVEPSSNNDEYRRRRRRRLGSGLAAWPGPAPPAYTFA